METSLQGQMYIFLITTTGGLLIGLMYDFYRLFRYYSRPKRIKTFIQDAIFWLFLSLIIILFVNKINGGELRGFIFLGFTLGIILYSRLLSKRIIKSISYTINFLIEKIKKILNFIFSPFDKLKFKIKDKIKIVKKYTNLPSLIFGDAVRNIKTIVNKK